MGYRVVALALRGAVPDVQAPGYPIISVNTFSKLENYIPSALEKPLLAACVAEELKVLH